MLSCCSMLMTSACVVAQIAFTVQRQVSSVVGAGQQLTNSVTVNGYASPIPY